MSNSSRQFSDRRRNGKSPAPEKSNFVQTCNLLSQYLKGKGSLRDLNLEIGGKVESLEAIVNPGSTHAASSYTTSNPLTSIEKPAQTVVERQPTPVYSPVVVVEDATANNASTSNERIVPETKSAQLTIFYSGKVLVFEDYPEEKARKLVSLAKKESSQMSYGILSNIGGGGGGSVASTSSAREGLPPRPQAAGSGKQPVGISSNVYKEKTNEVVAVASSSTAQEQLSPQPEANGSELPIARRSSLHRFLEKRKDRAVARGPYQIQERPASSPKGGGQLDLNF